MKNSVSNAIVKFLKHNKMKKIYIILLAVFLNMAFFSCTPNSINEDSQTPQACCGEEGEILPPPPPPPPTGGGN